MTAPNSGNSRNGKWLTGLLGGMAVISGFAALWVPIYARLDSVDRRSQENSRRVESLSVHEERLAHLSTELVEHRGDGSHPGTVMRLTAIEEKMKEIETQFRHQDRLQRLLWNRVYEEPLPDSTIIQ